MNREKGIGWTDEHPVDLTMLENIAKTIIKIEQQNSISGRAFSSETPLQVISRAIYIELDKATRGDWS